MVDGHKYDTSSSDFDFVQDMIRLSIYLDYSKFLHVRPSLNDSLFAVLLPINFSVGR